MADSQPLRRQWNLLMWSNAFRFGATVGELAEEMEISQKTIRRDLETLQVVGFPLEPVEESHGRKRWRLDGELHSPGLTFSLEEVAALHLGRRFLEPLAGTVFWDGSQKAFRKIRSVLGNQALRYLEKMACAFHRTTLGQCDYSDQAELIDRLMIGIEDRKITFVTYQSVHSTEPVTYELYPYGLVSHRQALYLVAFAPDRREIRHYKVNRMHDVEVQTLPFNKPADFHLATYFEQTFGVYHDGSEPTQLAAT